MELTEDEIIHILKLLEESSFDELRLEMGNLKLVVSKAGPLSIAREEYSARAPTETVNFDTSAVEPKHEEHEFKAQVTELEDTSAIEKGLLVIKAPMLGMFYAKPEPEAPPYVDVGTFVDEETTVCLLELMKVFSAVRAGVRGYIHKVCAKSGQMVEYGQTLFLVKPDSGVEEHVQHPARNDS